MVKITLTAHLRAMRDGYEARSPQLELTMFGLDEKDALNALRRCVSAWATSLAVHGQEEFERVLKRRKVTYSDSAELEIDLVVIDEGTAEAA